jgi:4'-phosphopantetheinyl transferase
MPAASSIHRRYVQSRDHRHVSLLTETHVHDVADVVSAGLRHAQAAHATSWRAPLDVPPSVVAGLWRSLSSDERERAQRFHRESDRRRFTVRRGRLRALLAGYLDATPAEIVLALDDRGKPRLRSPDFTWLRFNLSRSAEVVVFAVAHSREVGVDVEQVRPDFPVDEVARRFLTVDERAALASLPDQGRVEAFFATWTRKEAYLKALGVGLGQEDATAEADPGTWSLVSFEAGAGYAAAVAVEGRDVHVPDAAQPLSLTHI